MIERTKNTITKQKETTTIYLEVVSICICKIYNSAFGPIGKVSLLV